jgi:endonuclease YncB( thermonuclease family)
MGACLTLVEAEARPQPVERPELVLEPPHVRTKVEQLENLDPNVVPKVPMQNEIIDARIEEIYDGDTVKIIVLFGDVPFRISLRILGVDAPEIKHGAGRLPQEHEAAVKVREYLNSLFPKNIAKVKFTEWDKYGGRILGHLYTSEGEDVSELLISGGWARVYQGEKKRVWTLEELTSEPFA